MRTKHNTVTSDSNDDQIVVVRSVRMTPDQAKALTELAKRRHRSVSGELRVAIDTHIAQGKPELEQAA